MSQPSQTNRKLTSTRSTVKKKIKRLFLLQKNGLLKKIYNESNDFARDRHNNPEL